MRLRVIKVGVLKQKDENRWPRFVDTIVAFRKCTHVMINKNK